MPLNLLQMHSLSSLGYTYLYAESDERALQLYQLFPSVVRAVLMEPDSVNNCFRDGNHCIKSDINPEGFPIWLLFSFYFWRDPAHPLGAKWVLSPEDYAGQGISSNTFLGYSVEPGCLEQPFIPHSERPHQAYAMAKRRSYFSDQPYRAWPLDFYDAAANATGIRIVVGTEDDSEWAAERGWKVPGLPSSIDDKGVMTQDKFMNEVAHSRVLIGVGSPAM